MLIWQLLHLSHGMTLEQLLERELRSSYGYEVLRHFHNQDVGLKQQKNFKGQTLAYYFPWRFGTLGTIPGNPRGRQFSLLYIHKFDYYVPSFYSLEKEMHNPQTKGEHKLQKEMEDLPLIKQLKAKSPTTKILPRVTVSGFMGDVLVEADADQQKMAQFKGFLDYILAIPEYDGLVFCSTFLTPNLNHRFPFKIKNIVAAIKERTEAANKLFFLSMEGTDDPSDRQVNKKQAKEVTKLADRVLVQCYEYPKQVSGRVAPLSPIQWIRENIQLYEDIMGKEELKKKVFILIPFFGKFTSLIGKMDTITGAEVIPKLAEEKQNWMQWDSDDCECSIAQNRYQYIMYPCLNYFKHRYEELERRGLGVGVVQIGSGVELFLQQL